MIKIDAYLEFNPPEFITCFLDDEIEVECELEEDQSMDATLIEKYEEE